MLNNHVVPLFLYHMIESRGVARNFMKMKPAKRIFNILAEAQRFLQDCTCAQRSSKDSWDAWLISAKQWLLSACAFAQADLSHCLADMWSHRKCYVPAHLMSSEQVWGENKVELPNLCWSPGFIGSAWLHVGRSSIITYVTLNKRDVEKKFCYFPWNGMLWVPIRNPSL